MKTREATFVEVSPQYGLRPYQKKAVNEVLYTLRQHNRALLHAPTGAGKTRMAMSVISMHLREHGPTTVLWLAPTKELVSQAASDFASAWGRHGDTNAVVIQWRGKGEKFTHGTTIRRNMILVAGIQMAVLSAPADSWIETALHDQVSLVVFDEAHHSVARTYREFVERIVSVDRENRILLGLSATPGRANPEESAALAEMYDERKISIGDGGNPVRYLVEKRFLAKANFVTHPFSGSSNPPAGGQDYSEEVLSTLGQDNARNNKIVEVVRGLFSSGHKRVIAFTPSVRSAERCAELLRSADDTYRYSFAVSGSTPTDVREHYIATFSTPVAQVGRPKSFSTATY